MIKATQRKEIGVAFSISKSKEKVITGNTSQVLI